MKPYALLALLMVGESWVWAEDPASEAMEGYRRSRPSAEALSVYSLDWCADLARARQRAARENRPIFLLTVSHISSGGNLYTGHC